MIKYFEILLFTDGGRVGLVLLHAVTVDSASVDVDVVQVLGFSVPVGTLAKDSDGGVQLFHFVRHLEELLERENGTLG